jgi:hypothetical protein
VVNTIEKLKKISCPYVEGLDDNSIKRLILSPGEARVRLLKWLLDKFHPQLLQSQLLNSKGIVERLTLCFAELQLSDFTSPKENLDDGKDVKALEVLSELVYFSQCGCDRVDYTDQCCRFLDDMCHQTDVISLSHLSLISPVVAHMCSISQSKTEKSSSLPTLANLQEKTRELNEELKTKEKQLNELMSNHKYKPVDKPSLISSCQSLQVTMTTLSQLISDFTHQYQSEIKLWAGKREFPASYGCLGDRAFALKAHLQTINELLTCINVIMNTSGLLEKAAKVTVHHHKGTY